MTERVVDRLEIVEIEEDEGGGLRCLCDRLGEADLEEQTVGELGQRIVMGLVREVALEVSALRERDRQLIDGRRETGQDQAEEDRPPDHQADHDAVAPLDLPQDEDGRSDQRGRSQEGEAGSAQAPRVRSDTGDRILDRWVERRDPDQQDSDDPPCIDPLRLEIRPLEDDDRVDDVGDEVQPDPGDEELKVGRPAAALRRTRMPRVSRTRSMAG